MHLDDLLEEFKDDVALPSSNKQQPASHNWDFAAPSKNANPTNQYNN